MITKFENYNGFDAYEDNSIWKKALNDENYDTIKYMIENGFDVNKKLNFNDDSKNETGIMVSAYDQNYNITKLLIDNGADLYAEDYNWNNVLMKAIFGYCEFGYDDDYDNDDYDNDDVIKLILDNTNNSILTAQNKKGKTFMFYLNNTGKNMFKNDYPEKYKYIETHKKAKDFNL